MSAEAPRACDHSDHGRHRLEVHQLHVHYGKICALHDVSFATKCGRSVALIGCNGAGKSTLLKALVGLLPSPAGSVMWRGQPLSENPFEIAYLPQREEVDWDFPLTVRGLVEMGRYPHLGPWKRFSNVDHQAVDRALEALDLMPLAKRHISELSGGQQQRTFIARALAQEAHVLLLDEPFAGLDRPSAENLGQLMSRLADGGRLVIASHHDLETVPDLFDEVLMVNRAQVAFGSIDEAFTEENIRRALGQADAVA